MTDYYTDQDKFLSMMIEAYENKEIPCWYVFKPYFDWKKKHTLPRFTTIELRAMHRTAVRERDKIDDMYPEAWNEARYDGKSLFSAFQGFGKDKFKMAYLTAIADELGTLSLI